MKMIDQKIGIETIIDDSDDCEYIVVTMRTKIIPIGNSRGIRIPSILLKESGIEQEVEIKKDRDGLRISPVSSKKRAGSTALLTEHVLSADWNRPQEDTAWKNL